jgi:hypothetical protein
MGIIKKYTVIIILILSFTILNCDTKEKEMEPISSKEEAIKLIESYQGDPEKFILPISNELNDPMGMNMAIIADAILKKGFEPNGFMQKSNYRIYKYKKMD